MEIVNQLFQREKQAKIVQVKDSQKDMPVVSVIVPVYNGAEFLSEALDSIIAQTHTTIEVIVVDDGSTDATAEIAKWYTANIRYIYMENQGPAAARNLGIQQAQHSLLAFLDADDLWEPEKLRSQVEYLDSNPESLCVSVKLRHFVESGAQSLMSHRQEWLDKEFASRLFSCLLVRRSVFDRVGMLDPTLRFGEDIEWLTRLDEAGILCPFVDRVLVRKRVHLANVSNQSAAMKTDTISALHRSIQRRRGEVE